MRNVWLSAVGLALVLLGGLSLTGCGDAGQTGKPTAPSTAETTAPGDVEGGQRGSQPAAVPSGGQSKSNGDAAPTADSPQTPNSAGAAASLPAGERETRYVSADYAGAIIARPQQIIRSPLVKSLEGDQKEELITQMQRNIGMDPRDIDLFVGLMGAIEPTPPANDAPPQAQPPGQPPGFGPGAGPRELGGGVIYFNKPFDKEEFAQRLQAQAFFPDAQTAVFSTDPLVLARMKEGGATSPLIDQLKKSDLSGDVVFVGALDPVRDIVRQGIAQAQLPPPVALMAPALEHVETATISLKLGEKTPLKVLIDATSPETAKQLQNMLNGLHEMGKGMVAQQVQQLPPNAPASQRLVAEQGAKLIEAITIASQDDQVSVTVTTPEGFIEAIKTGFSAATEAAGRTQRMNGLKQIALAMHFHNDARKSLPAVAARNAEGKPLLSWRVQLLPYLEESVLYDKFHLDEPWDSPHNIKLAAEMPSIYAASPAEQEAGKTRLVVPVGEGTPFGKGKRLTFGAFVAGLANTIMVVEVGADKAVPWTKPDDANYDPANPLAIFGKVEGEGLLAVFADGHVEAMPKNIDAGELHQRIAPRGE